MCLHIIVSVNGPLLHIPTRQNVSNVQSDHVNVITDTEVKCSAKRQKSQSVRIYLMFNKDICGTNEISQWVELLSKQMALWALFQQSKRMV